MFRIRRIHDDLLPINAAAIGQVQALLRAQFPGMREERIDALPAQLHAHGFCGSSDLLRADLRADIAPQGYTASAARPSPGARAKSRCPRARTGTSRGRDAARIDRPGPRPELVE
jgi:hypothetical protein